MGSPSINFVPFAFLQGGVGMAIGVSLGISKKFAIRAASSVVLGFVGFLAGGGLWVLVTEGREIGLYWPDMTWAIGQGALLSVAGLSFHELFLRYPRPLAALAYPTASIGILFLYQSMSEYPDIMRETWLVSAVQGAVFGSLQFLGILAAIALDRRMRRRLEPPPPAPSPGP